MGLGHIYVSLETLQITGPWAQLVLKPTSGNVKGTKAASQSRQGILRLPQGISILQGGEPRTLTPIKGVVGPVHFAEIS